MLPRRERLGASGMGRHLSAVLLVLFTTLHHASAAGLYVEQADIDLAAKANTKAEEYCSVRSKMEIEDRAELKDDLLVAAGGNPILTYMRESESPDELTDKMVSELPMALIGRGVPLFLALSFFIIYIFICCWTICPFCQCCRCGAKRREVHPIAKIAVLLVLGALALLLILLASLSTQGYNKAVEGFEVTSCTAAQLVNSTMNGQENPVFLGLIPTLTIFDNLYQSLDPNSQFITDLKAVLLDTQKISDATALTSATLRLLGEMMNDPANKRPSSGGQDLLHECVACDSLGQKLSPVVDIIDSSLAKALSSAREEVDKQLSGDSLTSLQTSMEAASAPLIQLKTTVRGSFGPFVDTALLQDVAATMNTNGTVASVFMILFALALTGCGCLSTTLWLCKETSRNAATGEKDFNPIVHRCAACTWCCGCGYTMLAFFLGGLLLILATPFASLCLIMEDVNSEMLTDIGSALDLDTTADEFIMMADMVDECFRNDDPLANPRLLDLVTITENGTKVTMYEKIVSSSQEQINAQFDNIAAATNGTTPTLNTSPEIVALKDLLRTVPMDSMILPVAGDVWTTDAKYKDMSFDTRSSDSLSTYLGSSAACGDYTISAGMPGEGTTAKGVNSFRASLSYFGSLIPDATCAQKVLCNPAGTVNEGKACASGNNFMELKQGLRTGSIFKCRRFVDGGVPCDVINMWETFPGSRVYSGTCLKADGSPMEIETYDCDIAEFTNLVKGFETRLDKVLARMDDSTAATKDEVVVNMRTLLDTYFLIPIETVGKGVTCGFLGQAYQGVIDGMCYGGAWGIRATASSYTACAYVTLVIIIMMYIQWRLAIDNYNSKSKVLCDSSGVVPG